MANETLIARLEQNLRQSRAARTRLAARLAELESEAEIIRGELAEMDTLAGQTEAAIFRSRDSRCRESFLSKWTPLIHTRLQPGDWQQQELPLTVSTVSRPGEPVVCQKEKPLKRLLIQNVLPDHPVETGCE